MCVGVGRLVLDGVRIEIEVEVVALDDCGVLEDDWLMLFDVSELG